MATVLLRHPKREVTVDGARQVKVILRDLQIDPETVLVIKGNELLTREDIVGPDDVIELRPVISGGANTAKCRRCLAAKAVVELRRHNTAFCRECFLHFFRTQVERAIEAENMLSFGDRVLVAVSGGKDSLALWEILHEVGYDTTGYHIVLWTGEDYATASRDACRTFADARGLKLIETDVKDELGFTIPDLPKLTGRATCSACGLTKRHLVSKAARDGGFDVVATGHNLDDEAAALLGNTLRWEGEYLARQRPVLPEGRGFAKKVKPLYKLSEKETASYAFLRGIDYEVDECPQVAGNTQLRYKRALDVLEATSPGTKAAFYSNFLDRGRERFDQRTLDEELHPCTQCGMPTPGDTCAFCRMVALAVR